MFARDIMTTPVVTIRSAATVKELADLLLASHISGVPVVDKNGKVVGMVSEGDLIRRAELGTARQTPWWLRLIAGRESEAADFIQARASKVSEIMRSDIIAVTPQTTLSEVARILEENDVKRVPVIENDTLVGIVSRANLIRAFATFEHRVGLGIERSDEDIRKQVEGGLARQSWMRGIIVNCLVEGGVANLWGFVPNETLRTAIRVAAESTPGVKAVNDHLVVRFYETAA